MCIRDRWCSMSAAPYYSPIIREVENGGVMFNGKRYEHEELHGYEGGDVKLDMEIDVDTEKSSFRVYTMFDDEICAIEIDDVESIGEAVNG